jgi:hypothetical protein
VARLGEATDVQLTRPFENVAALRLIQQVMEHHCNLTCTAIGRACVRACVRARISEQYRIPYSEKASVMGPERTHTACAHRIQDTGGPGCQQPPIRAELRASDGQTASARAAATASRRRLAWPPLLLGATLLLVLLRCRERALSGACGRRGVVFVGSCRMALPAAQPLACAGQERFRIAGASWFC